MKRPAFQFYPGDWRKDVELRSCSIAARGLWIDLMCVMHDCDPYGHLVLNGKPMTLPQISGQIGLPPMQLNRLLDELLCNGVARKNDQGAIFSKRMVADERVRMARAEGGKAGSEHGIKGAEHGIKGGRPPASKGGSETPLVDAEEPPPSSSSSSSSTSSLRSEKTARKRSVGFDASGVELPSWLAREDWARWCAERVGQKKPISEAAAHLQLEKLGRFMAQGHDPKDVIDTAISNGWQGLYAPTASRVQQGATVNRQEAIEARNRAVGAEWLAQQGDAQ